MEKTKIYEDNKLIYDFYIKNNKYEVVEYYIIIMEI